jgi:hypothetical protein
MLVRSRTKGMIYTKSAGAVPMYFHIYDISYIYSRSAREDYVIMQNTARKDSWIKVVQE